MDEDERREYDYETLTGIEVGGVKPDSRYTSWEDIGCKKGMLLYEPYRPARKSARVRTSSIRLEECKSDDVYCEDFPYLFVDQAKKNYRLNPSNKTICFQECFAFHMYTQGGTGWSKFAMMREFIALFEDNDCFLITDSEVTEAVTLADGDLREYHGAWRTMTPLIANAVAHVTKVRSFGLDNIIAICEDFGIRVVTADLPDSVDQPTLRIYKCVTMANGIATTTMHCTYQAPFFEIGLLNQVYKMPTALCGMIAVGDAGLLDAVAARRWWTGSQDTFISIDEIMLFLHEREKPKQTWIGLWKDGVMTVLYSEVFLTTSTKDDSFDFILNEGGNHWVRTTASEIRKLVKMPDNVIPVKQTSITSITYGYDMGMIEKKFVEKVVEEEVV